MKAKASVVVRITQQHALVSTVLPQGCQRRMHQRGTDATTLVRGARFDTTDFATAKGHGCEGFALLVSRTRADSPDGWFGAFQRGDERIDVIGHLE